MIRPPKVACWECRYCEHPIVIDPDWETPSPDAARCTLIFPVTIGSTIYNRVDYRTGGCDLGERKR